MNAAGNIIIPGNITFPRNGASWERTQPITWHPTPNSAGRISGIRLGLTETGGIK